jgi:exportin-7
MECSVQIASVRRSIFASDKQRGQFISLLLAETTDIIRNETGLQKSENFHALCRLIARLKATFQLTEMVERQEFPNWLHFVTEFTIKGFSAWDVGVPTIHSNCFDIVVVP